MNLKDRLTPGILEALAKRKASAKSVAALYNVSEAYLSRTLKELHLHKIPAPTMEQKRTSKMLKANRTAHRLALAKQVLASKPIRIAAREANCSIRTMYRYVELIK